MSFEIDRLSLNATISQIERMIPRALAGTLSTVAFQQREALIAHSEAVFDRPKPYTQRAWRFERAKASDGDRMYSSIYALPDQARYLSYQIRGGVRRRGDVGAGPFDVPVDATNRDRFGNIRRNFIGKTAAQARTERDDRRSLRSRRRAAKAAGASPEALRSLSWISQSRNKPGVFFAEIEGVRGYWRRPKRTKAARKRRNGIRSVRALGGPELVVQFAEAASYTPIFKYNDVVQRTHSSYFTSAQFNRELQRAIDRHS